MKTQSFARQGGFTFWGIAFNVLVLGGFLVLLLRIAPAYLEYMTIKDIVNRAGEEFDPVNDGLQDIRTRIRKLLNTSQIYDIKAEDIEIYREKGKVVIDATYEVRFPLVWIVDGVMHFDDLIVEVDGR
ncbi:MAG: hypothetical protein RLZZ602_3 [Pseudomonadota bacterium]